MERGAIERTLDGCLLTVEEMSLGQSGWQRFRDPFPDCDLQLGHNHDG